MHHICQFSLCRLQVESWAIGREVQVWFQVPRKKSFFLRPFLGSTPLRSSSKSKIRSHKENEIFPSFCCIILLQQGCNNPVPGLLQPCTMVVTVSITRLNTRLLQPCSMVVTTLNYNLVTTLLHPCNKVVISVWDKVYTYYDQAY